jgi:ABC-type spermidine/putrescine transport system permease subunit II
VYEKTRLAFWMGIGIAFIASIISARLGIMWGDWMRRVRR